MKTVVLCLFAASGLANANPEAIATLLKIGPEGEGNEAATAAWSQLTAEPTAAALMASLNAIDGAGPLAANYLRAAAEVIAEKTSELPLADLGEYFLDRSHSPAARRFAFELIAEAQPATAEALVPGLLYDPSPELRRDAVARLMKQAADLAAKDQQQAATVIYRQALTAAVDPAQVKPIAAALKEAGHAVDLPKQFGFLMHWHVIGPFGNKDRAGYNTIYPPENKIDLKAVYDGLTDKVRWQPLASSDPFGKVDLNKPFGMLKETAAYAYTEYEASAAGPAELRLGCKNAWKIWLNGELVFARDEYHRGQRIDQYKLPVQLQSGKNTILVKACQNEQTEEWTVQWEFQLRVTDATGSAILATNRRPTPKAEATNRRRRPQ